MKILQSSKFYTIIFNKNCQIFRQKIIKILVKKFKKFVEKCQNIVKKCQKIFNKCQKKNFKKLFVKKKV